MKTCGGIAPPNHSTELITQDVKQIMIFKLAKINANFHDSFYDYFILRASFKFLLVVV
jgi:hypothetical protein